MLDTDTFSGLPRDEHETLRWRMPAIPSDQIWISAVTVDEVLKGVLSAINMERKDPNPDRMESLYHALTDSLRILNSFNILEYSADDEKQWSLWAKAGVTRGRTMD